MIMNGNSFNNGMANNNDYDYQYENQNNENPLEGTTKINNEENMSGKLNFQDDIER
jgi:hypothetical protein